MTVKRYGNPVLRRKGDPVTSFDDGFRQTVTKMREAMLVSDGVGLAAQQVGISQRFFIMGIPVDTKHREGERTWYVIANPVRVDHAETEVLMEEGCLSFPNLYIEVYRPEAVTVKYQDEYGAPHEMRVDGYIARVVLHEYDHLEGILFIDRISPLKRSLLRKKLKALQEV